MSSSSAEDKLNGFFSTLSEELNDCIPKTEEVTFARDRQVQRMRKRAAFVNPSLQQLAIAKFQAINEQVGSTVITLDRQLVRDARHFIVTMLERFNSRIDPENIQTALDLAYLYDNWRFGPGASNGIRGTHVAEKIVQDMTCTLSAVPFVVRLRCNPYFRLHDELRGSHGYTVMRGSRLTTVPKNETTERTIAIEPSGNMALQLAAGRYLEGVLRYIGIDIRDQQPKNKLLALAGSVDGSLATIDLSSASDMISVELVRLLMPEDWFHLLMRLRSPEIQLPCGNWLTLNMVSTMGNGFTFPLMTLMLAALLYGFRASRSGPNLFIDWAHSGIFGDDIIIPSSEFQAFSEVLREAGLVVNYDKSFYEGFFRESCGGDYFKGADVTPFYVRRLDSDPSVYVAINQVFEWCARNNILLHRSLLYLRGLLHGDPFLVPEWHNPDQGILTSQCPPRYRYLQPIVVKRVLIDSVFTMMLAVGGYIEESGPDKFYVPRLFKTKAHVRRSRLPKGFLDGADPRKRSARASCYIGAHAPWLFQKLEE